MKNLNKIFITVRGTVQTVRDVDVFIEQGEFFSFPGREIMPEDFGRNRSTRLIFFQIALEAMAKDITMVKVRIGLLGNEAYSRKIQEGIASNLRE